MEYGHILEDAKSFLFGWFAGADYFGDSHKSVQAAIETAASLMQSRIELMAQQSGGNCDDIRARLISDLTASIDSIKADIK